MAARKRHPAEEIVRRLRRADELAAEGKNGEEIAAALKVSAATLYNWRRQYAGISIATGYRYSREGIDVLAAQAPELPDVLRERLAAGDTHVILDGTLIPSDRVAETTLGSRGTPSTCGMPVNTADSVRTSSS